MKEMKIINNNRRIIWKRYYFKTVAPMKNIYINFIIDNSIIYKFDNGYFYRTTNRLEYINKKTNKQIYLVG